MRALALVLVTALSAADAHGAAIELAGRAQAEDGAPLAGAAVELRAVEDSYTGARRTWTGEAAPPLARGVADRDGFFALRAPGPGMYAVRVSAAGRTPLAIAALPLVEPIVLPPAVLLAATETPVRVVDGDGKPVAGAVLQPVEAPVDVVVPTWRPGWPAVRSGADGRAAIALPRKAEPARWTATAAGFVPRRVEISGLLTIALAPAPPTAELRVRELDGRPVAGALVATTEDDLPLAVTGADGSARLALAAGPFEVLAADGRVWKGRPPRAAPGAPTPAPATVTLPPPVALSGGAVDAEDRAPLANAVVASTADLGRWTLADARGSYVLRNPGEGRLGLMAWASAHFRGDAAVAAGRGPTLVLLPGAVVTGRVIDPGRQAISGAKIALALGRSADFRLRDRYPLRPAASGRDGGFSLLAPPRVAAKLQAAARGFAPRSVALPALAARGRPAAVTIVLDGGHALIGRIADPAGAPVAGAEVEVLLGVEGLDLYVAAVSGAGARTGSHAAVTGAEGAFRLEHLAAGKVALVSRKEGFAPAVLPGVAIAAGQPTTDVGLVHLLPGAALEGVVTDGRRPLAGASVALRLSRQSSHSGLSVTLQPVTTGDDGAFRFADLAPGTVVDLEVSHPGFEHRTLSKVAAPTERPLKIVLAKASQIAGRVLAEDRSPVAGAQVRSDAEDHEIPFFERMRGIGRTDEDGAFLLDETPSGRVWLEVTAHGFEKGKVDGLDVPAGGRLDGVEVVLKRGAAVAGTVTTEDGLPAAGASVGAAGAWATTDGEGAYRLEGVPAGRQRVFASSPEHGSAFEQVEVGPGETRVDLRVSAGATLQGQVVDRAGSPVAGVPVSLQPRGPAGRWETGESDVQGGFRFDHLAAGSYQVSAGRGPWGTGATRTVDVGAEPLAGVVLTYDRQAALSGHIAGVRQEDLATLAVEAGSARASSVPGDVAADGSYRIEGLAAGDWLVTAAAGATGRRGQGRITIGEGAEESHLDLTLGSGLTLQGIVRRNGSPVDGAQVDVASDDGRLAQSDSTDHLGAFRIEGLAPGSYQLGVVDRATQLRDARTLDLREDQTVAIDLAGGALVGVLVDGVSGGPLNGADARLETPAGGMVPGGQGRGSDAQGHVGFDPVAAGAFVLVVSKPGYATQKVPVSVEQGATATLEVTLVPAPAGEAPPPATPPHPPRSAPASRSAPRP